MFTQKCIQFLLLTEPNLLRHKLMNKSATIFTKPHRVWLRIKTGSWWYCLQIEVVIKYLNLCFPPLIICKSGFWTFLLFSSDPLYLTATQNSLIGFPPTTKKFSQWLNKVIQGALGLWYIEHVLPKLSSHKTRADLTCFRCALYPSKTYLLILSKLQGQ